MRDVRSSETEDLELRNRSSEQPTFNEEITDESRLCVSNLLLLVQLLQPHFALMAYELVR